ncbi:MAG: hypothetical protein ACI9LT_000335 [Pseudoalteromonas distincta]|jgi:hypothetical protein
MSRNTAMAGRGQGTAQRGPASIACLAFVAVLSLAFWAGAALIVQHLFSLMALG